MPRLLVFDPCRYDRKRQKVRLEISTGENHGNGGVTEKNWALPGTEKEGHTEDICLPTTQGNGTDGQEEEEQMGICLSPWPLSL